MCIEKEDCYISIRKSNIIDIFKSIGYQCILEKKNTEVIVFSFVIKNILLKN